jgi:hypothetical protein
MNKVMAFSKGKKVAMTLAVKDAKSQDVAEYRRKYGKKAIYIKNGVEYVKPFIRVHARAQIDII